MQEVALKILVVEDNDELRQATLAFLQSEGHFVRGVAMAEDISDVTGGFVPDVYIVDLNLPDEDGLTLTRRLRAAHPNVGIVITTARTQIGDRVEGYASGADLYLPKPVHPRELMAGVSALGKRVRGQSQPDDVMVFHLSRLELEGPSGTVVALTAGEAQVLSALVRAPGQSLERWQIAEIMGVGRPDAPSSATLEMRIARLRKKLGIAGGAPPCIKALHRFGYLLCCPVSMQ